MILYIISEIEDEADRAFILELYLKYGQMMLYIANKVVEDRSAAEDLLQESIVRLIPKASLLRDMIRPKLEAYIVYTVRNTAITYKNRKKGESKYISFAVTDELIEQAAETQRETEEKVELSDRAEQVYRVITALPDRDREIIVRKYYLEQSDAEIAEAVGCQTNSVRMLLTRSRRRAFELLKERGVEL